MNQYGSQLGIIDVIKTASVNYNNIERENKDVVLVEEGKDVKIDTGLAEIHNLEEAAQVSPNNDIALANNTLYAQPKENGFQLINAKPQVVFVILNTGVKDIYVIKDKNGLLYKKGENWIAEFYDGGEIVVKKYSIKF